MTSIFSNFHPFGASLPARAGDGRCVKGDHHEHGHLASVNKVHKHSRANHDSRGIHFDDSTVEGIKTLYTAERKGMS